MVVFYDSATWQIGYTLQSPIYFLIKPINKPAISALACWKNKMTPSSYLDIHPPPPITHREI